MSESLIAKGIHVNLKIHIGEDSDEIRTVFNIMVRNNQSGQRLTPKQPIESKPKMKELEKQLRLTLKFSKQKKKLSHLRTARDASNTSVNKQTNDCSKTAKTYEVRGGKKGNNLKRENLKSLIPYIRISKQNPTLRLDLI